MTDTFDDYWARLCRTTPELGTMYPKDCVIKIKITAFKQVIAKAYRAGADDVLKSATSPSPKVDVADFLGGLFESRK